ncbi:unnamed protein product [Clonostachys rosea]|uniref:Uncharacterized protein n=1 Tax=Bionectria ochroleuca TaxID=29856 RepID=A0ABY6UCZ9_BIOOC|nr:unnamed protein product [Clonostachys rosea]
MSAEGTSLADGLEASDDTIMDEKKGGGESCAKRIKWCKAGRRPGIAGGAAAIQYASTVAGALLAGSEAVTANSDAGGNRVQWVWERLTARAGSHYLRT